MPITLREFAKHPEKLPVIIRSIDMVGYQAEVLLQDQPRLLLEARKKPLRHQSLSAMRTALAELPVASITLQHDSAYDEMIGQPLREAPNTLALQISPAPGAESRTRPSTGRLPCRGCTSACKNYDKCDGKPWRL